MLPKVRMRVEGLRRLSQLVQYYIDRLVGFYADSCRTAIRAGKFAGCIQ